jgi:hypothetical protein
VCEGIDQDSYNGKRIIHEVAIIDRFSDSRDAMKRYYELHRAEPHRQYYYFHTDLEKLEVGERMWV